MGTVNSFASAFKANITQNLVTGAKGALGHRQRPIRYLMQITIQTSTMDDVKVS